MEVIYPVIFTDTEDTILIEIPDLKIYTESNGVGEGTTKGTMVDAIRMARDAISLDCITREDEGEEVVKPSALEDIDPTKGEFADAGKSFVSLVDVDLSEYRRKTDNRSVRRNVTLPSWLNWEANKAQINVSEVLQEALMTKLGASR